MTKKQAAENLEFLKRDAENIVKLSSFNTGGIWNKLASANITKGVGYYSCIFEGVKTLVLPD